MAKGQVARLLAGGRPEGSAWLIDETHALTALHCVQAGDGTFEEDVALVFFGRPAPVSVDIEQVSAELDVALLKVRAPAPGLAAQVFPLARGAVERDDPVTMRGYPALAGGITPAGTEVRGTVQRPCAPYYGSKNHLDCRAVIIDGVRESGLQGLSGGVLTWDGDDGYAAGLVIEEMLGGRHICCIAVADIAAVFPPVAQALADTPHVAARACAIHVEKAAPSGVRWASALPLPDLGRLWSGEGGGYSVYCALRLREMGPLGGALMRLCAYAGLKTIVVPDREDWENGCESLGRQHYRPPESTPNIVAHGAVPPAPASPWRHCTAEQLAADIHAQLDLHLLDLLADQLYRCLARDDHPGIGIIEPALKNAMWNQWLTWESLLRNDAALLANYLVRVFDLDGAAGGNSTARTSIGCCRQGREQLLYATLLALALSASGVAIAPHRDPVGNLSVDTGAGHACGVKTWNRRAVQLLAATFPWKASVLFLPYMGITLRREFEKAMPMTSAEGTLSHPLRLQPPVAITATNEFLFALETGAAAVREYYDDLVAGRAGGSAPARVWSPTEILHG